MEKIVHKSFFSVVAIYFFLGFAAIIVQSVLIREFLVIAYGNELIIGTLFATWFLGIAIGAGLGFPLFRQIKNPYFVFWVILFVGLIFFPFQVLAIRLGKIILSVPTGMYMSFSQSMAWSVICISPFSLVIGFTFPFGVQLFQNVISQRIKIIGSLYLFEAAGSLFGGLFFTFYLINHTHPFQLNYLLWMFGITVMLLSGKSILAYRKVNTFIFICILIGVIFTFFNNSLQNWSSGQRWLSISNKQNQLISDFDTPYEHISISRLGDQFSLFQNGQLSSSFPDPYSNHIRANLILLQHKNPRNVLVIGHGIQDLVHPMLLDENVEVDLVLQDQKLLSHLEPLIPDSIFSEIFNQRLDIYLEDGRYFLVQQKRKYDLIYLNIPSPSTAALNRYYSLEFFQLAQRSLKSDGILAFTLPVSDNYLGEEILGYVSSICFTLKKVFGEVIITAGEKNYIFASKQAGILTTDVKLLISRWKKRTITASIFSPNTLYAFFDPGRISFIENKINSFSNPQLNTDLRPVSYFYNLKLWNKFSGGDKILSYLWQLFNRFSLLHLILFLFFLLIFRFLWQLFKTPDLNSILKYNSAAGVAISGFTAMGLEIILLYGFQNLFGSLYRDIALVTAVFMFGLAIGCWIINEKLRMIRNLKLFFIGLEIAAIIIAISLPLLFNTFAQNINEYGSKELLQGLYLLIVVFVGLVTGAIFPLAGKGILSSGSPIGKTAGFVDAADHIGACIGAILVSTFLVPVIGIKGSVFVVASFNILAILLWLIPSFKTGIPLKKNDA